VRERFLASFDKLRLTGIRSVHHGEPVEPWAGQIVHGPL